MLNAGSLPVDLKEIYSNSVGAQFGQDALDKTVFASFIGVALIYLFMLGFYRLPGLVAIIALTTYIYLTLVAFILFPGSNFTRISGVGIRCRYGCRCQYYHV